jgi:hypothetical protein
MYMRWENLSVSLTVSWGVKLSSCRMYDVKLFTGYFS